MRKLIGRVIGAIFSREGDYDEIVKADSPFQATEKATLHLGYRMVLSSIRATRLTEDDYGIKYEFVEEVAAAQKGGE